MWVEIYPWRQPPSKPPKVAAGTLDGKPDRPDLSRVHDLVLRAAIRLRQQVCTGGLR